MCYGVGGTCGDMVVYLDYSISSGPFLRFCMRFELLSETFDHSICETRDPSLTICLGDWCLLDYKIRSFPFSLVLSPELDS